MEMRKLRRLSGAMGLCVGKSRALRGTARLKGIGSCLCVGKALILRGARGNGRRSLNRTSRTWWPNIGVIHHSGHPGPPLLLVRPRLPLPRPRLRVATRDGLFGHDWCPHLPTLLLLAFLSCGLLVETLLLYAVIPLCLLTPCPPPVCLLLHSWWFFSHSSYLWSYLMYGTIFLGGSMLPLRLSDPVSCVVHSGWLGISCQFCVGFFCRACLLFIFQP